MVRDPGIPLVLRDTFREIVKQGRGPEFATFRDSNYVSEWISVSQAFLSPPWVTPVGLFRGPILGWESCAGNKHVRVRFVRAGDAQHDSDSDTIPFRTFGDTLL